MQLWRDVVTEVHNQEYQDVELEHLYIDNDASYKEAFLFRCNTC